jgi:tetratricopeptide (TPR) repeat protein
MNKLLFALLCVLLAPALAIACLWDYDTLKMERARFPDTLELITGKFLRHSPEFYQWRIKDRQERLKTDPNNLALYDDLAVAYEKTGQRKVAIETIEKKDKLRPDLYETEANLGTFLMLDGQLEEARPHLQKAIEINPDAHFGREKYQLLLLDYMLSRQKNGQTTLPLAEYDISPDGTELRLKASFTTFLESQLYPGPNPPQLRPEDRRAALKGIMGMMKFADHQNPVLLEALGNVLAGHTNHPDDDAKQLAARAYLTASHQVEDEQAKLHYRLLARNALAMQKQPGNAHTWLELIEQELQRELQEADAWYVELKSKEIAWIDAGLNADAEFDKLYDKPPRIEAQSTGDIVVQQRRRDGWLAFGGLGGIVILVGALVLRYRRARPVKKPQPKGPYV